MKFGLNTPFLTDVIQQIPFFFFSNSDIDLGPSNPKRNHSLCLDESYLSMKIGYNNAFLSEAIEGKLSFYLSHSDLVIGAGDPSRMNVKPFN